VEANLWIKEGMDYSKERSVPYLRGAAKSLHDENVRLRAAQSELNARLAALEAKAQREHLARLAAEEEAERRNSALEAEREEKARMQDELTRLRHEIAALQEVLERRNQALYGRSTERRPRNDDKSSGTGKGKGKEKRKGHGPTEQPELPRVEVVHTLTAEKLVCDACGGQMSAVDTLAEKTELIAIEKRKVVLEQHLRTVYACSCKKCIKTAAGPLKLIPGGRYALSFTVHVAYQKYFAHLPLERQVQAFAHDGGRFTTAALWDQLDALATTLKATYDKIWQAIQAESVLHADETPWAVLSNGHTQNERFYAWVCVGATYVAFRLLDTRSAEGVAIVLGNFGGTLMVDGLTSYPAAAKGKPGEAAKFKVANCHAHYAGWIVIRSREGEQAPDRAQRCIALGIMLQLTATPGMPGRPARVPMRILRRRPGPRGARRHQAPRVWSEGSC
jgi:transposase